MAAMAVRLQASRGARDLGPARADSAPDPLEERGQEERRIRLGSMPCALC